MKQCKLKKLEDRLKNFIKRTLCHRNKNTSNKVCGFRKLVEYLRSKFSSTIVEYEQDKQDKQGIKRVSIKRVIEKAKGNLQLVGGNKCYGVYIIYGIYGTEKECEDLVKRGCGEVLYIGKGGTLECNASYKEQDVIERIGNTRSECKPNNRNTKNQYISSNEWFRNLSQQYGRICIEIICIDVLDDNNREPQCKLLTPAVIEKLLLCCYLHERGKLPRCNLKL